jgi:hypothetical protein
MILTFYLACDYVIPSEIAAGDEMTDARTFATTCDETMEVVLLQLHKKHTTSTNR